MNDGPLISGSEKLKNAIQWVSDEKTARPGRKPLLLADEAAVRFDLSPEESRFLMDMVTRAETE